MAVISSEALTKILVWTPEEASLEKEPDALKIEEGELEGQEAPADSKQDYLSVLLQLTQDAVRLASSLPTATDYSIEISDSSTEKRVARTVQQLTDGLFNILHISSPEKFNEGELPSVAVDHFSYCIDAILSKVDLGLSVFNRGSANAPVRDTESYVAASSKPKNEEKCQQPPSNRLLTSSAGIASERRHFAQTRFVPCLTTKPYGIVQIPEEILQAQDLRATGVLDTDSSILPHPYFDEVQDLEWQNQKKPESRLGLYEAMPPQLQKDMDSTPLIWVRSAEDLELMIQHMRTCKEVAIDVEHHSQHSYRGLTCLIQCSTRYRDYILDPFLLNDSLVNFNDITANPGILKVLHGADSDVLWLQKDFSIYIVNLFDTGQAARVIGVPGGASLSNLLCYYCQVVADKSFQLADWRVRPLTEDMVNYARIDTHYLLYIFDKLRLDILERDPDMMTTVLERSRNISLKLYTEPNSEFDDDTVAMIIAKHSIGLAPLNSSILQKLLRWRDAAARADDCAPHLILPTTVLIRLSDKMPTTWTGLAQFGYQIKKLDPERTREILELLKVPGHKNNDDTCRHQEDVLNVNPVHLAESCPSRLEKDLSPAEADDVGLGNDPSSNIAIEEIEFDGPPTLPTFNREIVTSVFTSVKKIARPLTMLSNEVRMMRRMQSLEGKVGVPPSLDTADGFQVILSSPMVSNQLKQQPSIASNGRLLARVVGKIVAREFETPVAGVVTIRPTKKRPRQSTEVTPNGLTSGESETTTYCIAESVNVKNNSLSVADKLIPVMHEILSERAGAKRRKRRSKVKLETATKLQAQQDNS